MILRKKRRLKVFVGRILRRIFGPKSDEVTGDWIKPHNEELHHLSSLPSIMRVAKSRGISYGGLVSRMGQRGLHK
jgi:hypothetical protein